MSAIAEYACRTLPPSNLIGANGFAVEDQSQGRRGLCAVADATGGLKLRKTQQDRDRERNAKRWKDTGLVFTTRYGTPIEPRNFNRSFDHRIELAKVRRITVHGTRKTCGTLLAALDVHPRVAMQILRHSKISVTMEIYTEATRDALKRLGDELSPPEMTQANTEADLSERQGDEPGALDPEQP